MKYVFELKEQPSAEIHGLKERFPINRIYCVGRNYAAHVKEMGKDPEREPPFFFCKPADAIMPSGSDVPYPGRTNNLHHEIELVVAIGKTAKNINVDDAKSVVFGYAVGNDITRRDLQLVARDTGRPWDTGKAFDHSAVISEIYRVEDVGHIEKGEIIVSVNGEVRQKADIKELIWSVSEIIAELSTFFELKPGDLIYTGTPAGVNKLEPGDYVLGSIEGLCQLNHRII